MARQGEFSPDDDVDTPSSEADSCTPDEPDEDEYEAL
jgi:hypothetical protein